MSRVLVVEDEGIVAMDIQNRLKHLGYDVPAVAFTGEDAVEKAMLLHPELVLMDIKLKGKMDGIAAAELIQERLRIPVIYLTAHSDRDTLERAKATGPYGYIIKPFEERELHTAIEIALYKHQMEKKLQESEQWLSTTLNSIGDALIATDVEGRVKFMNVVAEKLTGYRERDVLGRDLGEVFKIINEKTRFAMDNPVQKVLHEGMVVGLANHAVLLSADGREIPIDDSAAPIRDGEGNISGVVMVFRDITERKRSLDALRLSEDRYRDLVENSHDLICMHDLEGRILSVNNAAARMIGYDRHRLLGMNVRDILSPEAQDAVEDYLAAIRREGVASGIMSVRTRTGEKRIWEYNNTVRREGVPVPVVRGLAHDITEQEHSRKELKKALSLLHATLESNKDGIVAVDGNGKILTFNRRFTQMWGIPTPVIASRDAGRMEAFIADQSADPPGFLARIAEIYADRNKESYDELQCKNGRYFDRISQPQLLGNRIAGRVWNFRDVTRRKGAEDSKAALEEQVRHLQKMEAIGRLAGGIAHDFNNTLTAISGYSELLLARLEPADPMHREIEKIKKAGDRAAALTGQLLAFSRKQILQPVVMDLNVIITGMDKMIRRLIGENIELVTTLSKDLGSIRTDPGQVEQVIMNLAINAKDAMISGGKLTIETANTELDEEYTHTHAGVRPGRYVMLSLTDTGTGMTPEVRERIFEPFFTTKEKGKGTGLGLSSVYGTVSQSGGSIWVYSEPGRGTAFKLYFPRVDEAPERRPERERDAGLQGTETILVVEDDHDVRKLVVRVLQERGYTVLEASQGGEALLICEKYAERIHLVLTDVVMPMMNAPQLIERLRQIRQDFKVLYMSGYTDSAIICQGVLDEGINFIQKPFTLNRLAKKIREVLLQQE